MVIAEIATTRMRQLKSRERNSRVKLAIRLPTCLLAAGLAIFAKVQAEEYRKKNIQKSNLKQLLLEPDGLTFSYHAEPGSDDDSEPFHFPEIISLQQNEKLVLCQKINDSNSCRIDLEEYDFIPEGEYYNEEFVAKFNDAARDDREFAHRCNSKIWKKYAKDHGCYEGDNSDANNWKLGLLKTPGLRSSASQKKNT
jgi:hypothetical protein